MHIVENLLGGSPVPRGAVVTIGSFDGIHLGHRKLLDALMEQARAMRCPAAVMTMRPHPRELFSPEHPPNLLTPEKKKLVLFEETGVDIVYILPFTREVATLPHEEFAARILRDRLGAAHVVVGHDFRFGAGAGGDYETLRQMSGELGFSVTQVPPLVVEGECVSSTAIRERLLQGDLEKAAAFLGRDYSITGQVTAGRGIGVTLGFPTANIKPYHTAIPANGVYAAEVVFNGGRFPAAVNIGIAPTIAHDEDIIEAHILNFDANIRGEEIEIIFRKRLRPELKFHSHEELIDAIRRDVEAIRGYFGFPAGDVKTR